MKHDVIIYCDGGCRNNHLKENIGGWGAYINYLSHDVYYRYCGFALNTTNNKMELQACIKALESIKNKALSVLVIVDSKYVCDGINKWISGWISNGWLTSQKKPVKNKELWVELKDLVDEFKNIKFEWTKGHSYNEGNNIADELVNEAMDTRKE